MFNSLNTGKCFYTKGKNNFTFFTDIGHVR